MSHSRLLKKLEAIGWPAPLKDPLGEQDGAANEFKDAFADLLELEKMCVISSLRSIGRSLVSHPPGN